MLKQKAFCKIFVHFIQLWIIQAVTNLEEVKPCRYRLDLDCRYIQTLQTQAHFSAYKGSTNLKSYRDLLGLFYH